MLTSDKLNLINQYYEAAQKEQRPGSKMEHRPTNDLVRALS
jgi:hypothetical protein